ncbi:MAG: M28 family peptidase [Elusimicrobiota bacterium]|nr:M28 family peptidase [Elusimicrobiota bacterium]
MSAPKARSCKLKIASFANNENSQGYLFVQKSIFYYNKSMIENDTQTINAAPENKLTFKNSIAENLYKHLHVLAKDIGKRNHLHPNGLKKAINYIKYQFEKYGYTADQQIYKADSVDMDFENIIATLPGTKNKDSIIVIGAHYDTYGDTPGADDNGSAVGVLLELARLFKDIKTEKTLRFVAFGNEEPPFFKTPDMGSMRYAKMCKTLGENIEAMVCLESVGYYSDKPQSQKYPSVLKYFYPDTGNFLSIVSNMPSRKLLKKATVSFKAGSKLPIENLWAPSTLVNAITLSDQWAFWKCGYKAIMLCDTAFFRTPHYHTEQDTLEKLDYDKMADVVDGSKQILLDLSTVNQENSNNK